MWTTEADDSWIATRGQRIVRSKYGSVWQRDPDAGTIVWLDMKRKFILGGWKGSTCRGADIRGQKVFTSDTQTARGWLCVSKFRLENQAQYWKCTKDSNGRFGFLNIVTHKFL